MKDFFNQIIGQQNNDGFTNALGNNPNSLSLAGLIAATNGVPLGEALVQAAQISHNQQIANIERSKYQQQQQETLQRQQALQGLGSLMGNTNVEPDANTINQILYSGQFSPSEIKSLNEMFSPSAEENVVFNPVTGEAILKQRSNGRVTGFTPIQPQAAGQNYQASAGGEVFANAQPYETPVEAKERRSIENDYFKTLRDEVRSTNEASSALKAVERSLGKVNTGAFSGAKKTIGGIGRELFGSELNTGASDLANIDALSVSLIQPFIASTKGAVSDKEMAIFQSAVPNSSQLPETNKKIIEGMKLSIDRKKEKLKAAEAWRKSGKNLNDFEVVWAEYANTNPIISETSNGQVILNKNNVSNWKNNLGVLNKDMQPANNVMENNNYIQSLSNEELEAIARGQ